MFSMRINLYIGYQSHGGHQSNVSMTITASGVNGTTISIVNSQSIRVALSSLLDSSRNRN